MSCLEYSIDLKQTDPENLNFRKVHRCRKCAYVTKSYFSIKNHIERHRIRSPSVPFDCAASTPELFLCKDCNYRTALTSMFNDHIKNHILITTVFTVQEDPERGEKPSTVEIGGRRFFQCDKCEYRTVKGFSLKRHKLAKHADGSIEWHQCEDCSYRTKFLEHLKGHISRKHSSPKDQKTYKCNQCSFKSTQSYYVQRHKVARHVAKDAQWFQCEICPYGSTTRWALSGHHKRLHVATEEWFHCDQCSYRSHSKVNLRTHLRSHSDDSHSCRYCEFQTKYKKCLAVHVLYKHSTDKDVKWFECDSCPYKGKTKGNLKAHIIMMHKQENIEWLQCDQCSYKAKLKSRLREHVKVHVKRKDVECKECSFRTKLEVNLKKHVLRKHSKTHRK